MINFVIRAHFEGLSESYWQAFGMQEIFDCFDDGIQLVMIGRNPLHQSQVFSNWRRATLTWNGNMDGKFLMEWLGKSGTFLHGFW